MKSHAITDLNGNPTNYWGTKTKVDHKNILYELSEMIDTNTLFD